MRSGPSRARALAVALAGVLGCASVGAAGAPAVVAADSAGALAAAPADAVDSTDRAGPPIVQIREFPGSSHVTIVAWSPDATNYGLRAMVSRRDGTLVGGWQQGDHGVYVSAAQVEVMGGFTRAWVTPVPPGPVLRHGGVRRDSQACNRGEECAPMAIIGVQMPNDLLRQHHDSMVVHFTGGRDRDWRIVLDAALIEAYLHTVDSVSAALRAPQHSASR